MFESKLPPYLTLMTDGHEYDTRYYEYENMENQKYWVGYKCIRSGKSVVYAASNHSMEAAKQVLLDILSQSEQIYRYANYAS